MTDKRLRNILQNLALVLLAALTLFLLSRLPALRGIQWTGRMQELLRPDPPAGVREPDSVPEKQLPSVQLLITGDSTYSRWGRINVPSEDPDLQAILPLFQEAVGSAAEVGLTAGASLREALENPGFYLDLTPSASLPLAALEPWLGNPEGWDREVRALALTAEGDGFAQLYLLEPDGSIYLYQTALPASAVLSICEGFAPNNSCFSYETNYGSLEPYTVLTNQPVALPVLRSELPAGYSPYNLLTALDFNAHTLSRYTESGGAEVVEESPRTLRISPNGAVRFISRGQSGSALFQAAGENPGLRELLAAGGRLATALTEGTGASPLRLRAVEETGEGFVLRFRYEVDGTPVVFSDAEDALSVTCAGGQITSFTYRCRSYTPVEEERSSMMLPAFIAQAVAAIYPNASLTVGYVDDGTGQMTAQWVAGSQAAMEPPSHAATP